MKKLMSMSLPLALALVMGVGSVSNSHAQTHGVDPILEWCNDSLTVLDYAEQNARMVYSMGRIREAKEILLGGLRQAGMNAPGSGMNGPITMRAIGRVTQIGNAIDRAISNDSLGDRTSVVFLFNGYDFIRQVAHDLDTPYYIPYNYGGYRSRCSRGCGNEFDIEAFEAAYVTYAVRQLDLVMDSLIIGRGPGATPLGVPRAILKALQIASAASASDLRNSIWAAHFSCEIRQLMGLSSKLSGFLNGDRILYRNEPEAFYASVSEGRYLVDMISSRRGCGTR